MSGTFYHYTTQRGLEGILRSGGLRATYRMKMNDPAEFKYARDLVFDSLNEFGSRGDFSKGTGEFLLILKSLEEPCEIRR